MKKLVILLCVLSLWGVRIHAQDFSTIKGTVLTDSLSCVQAHGMVLECANYLLSTPLKQELNALYAMDFIIEWMQKTENYSFTSHPKFFKTIKSDIYLSSRYYAALAKFAIEKNFEIQSQELQTLAISEFLAYSSNKKYRVTPSKKLQKYIDAYKNKTLEEMLW